MQISPKSLEIINDTSRSMAAGNNTGATANAEIRFDGYRFTAPIIAKLDRANTNTSMAVDTFFIINFYHWRKMSNQLASSSSIECDAVCNRFQIIDSLFPITIVCTLVIF